MIGAAKAKSNSHPLLTPGGYLWQETIAKLGSGVSITEVHHFESVAGTGARATVKFAEGGKAKTEKMYYLLVGGHPRPTLSTGTSASRCHLFSEHSTGRICEGQGGYLRVYLRLVVEGGCESEPRACSGAFASGSAEAVVEDCDRGIASG